MKITLKAPAALYLIDAMLAAISLDETTPVITSANLVRVGKSLRATATDRYRVHEVTMQVERVTSAKGESVNVPASLLRWIKRGVMMLAPRRSDRAETTVIIQTKRDEGRGQFITATVTHAADSATFNALAVSGVFPPLRRIIDKALTAEPHTGAVAMNVSFLGKFNALNPDQYPGGRFQFTASEEGSSRPGPVIVTYESEGIAALGLLQPNLLLR